VVYLKYIKANEIGITLIELLLAMTLLMIILVTFMGFFTNAFQYNAMSSKKLQGVNFVREKEVDLKETAVGTEGPAFRYFIDHVLEGDGTLPLSKSDPNYANLHLSNDIVTVPETIKPELSDGISEDGEIEDYYLLELDSPDSPYNVSIYVKDTPDLENLYRLYIETYDNKNNLLSATYSYYQVQE
jgi:type II secretory pathway pseudopilin PulG